MMFVEVCGILELLDLNYFLLVYSITSSISFVLSITFRDFILNIQYVQLDVLFYFAQGKAILMDSLGRDTA